MSLPLETLLKQHYTSPDDHAVTLTVSTTLGALRRQHDALQALNVQTLEPTASKATRSATRKTPAAKRRAAKPAATKSGATSSATPRQPAKAPNKKSNGRLSQDAILTALKAGHTTAPAIAAAINGKQRQISNALSRYLKAGQVQRVGTGEYAPVEKAAA